MKGKQLALVLVLLVVLGGAALYLQKRDTASWDTGTAADEKILSFSLNDVTGLSLKGGGSEVNLVKKADLWSVAERDYPADFEKISSLIKKLWELHGAQELKVGASQLGRLELTEPASGKDSGTLITLKATGDKQIAALLLGKTHMQQTNSGPAAGAGFPAGRYVMVPDKKDHVFLITDTFAEVQTKPEQWLNHDFFMIENPNSIILTRNAPVGGWKMVRENASATWSSPDVKAPEVFDPAKAVSLSNTLTNLTFLDVLPLNSPLPELGLDNPSVIKAETFDGLSYEVKIGKLSGENYPVLISVKGNLASERKPEAEEKPEDKAKLDQQFEAKHKELVEKLAKEEKLAARGYLIPKSTIDQLLIERTALLKPPPSPSPTPASSASPNAGSPKPRPSASPAPSRKRSS